MNFDWKNYLDLAQYMVTNISDFPDDEACYRSSASRAYYAALNAVHVYVQKTDGESFKTDTHRKIRVHLKNSGHKLKRKIANQLEVFHKYRIEADYHTRLNDKPANMASKSMALSRKIIEEITSLAGNGD